MQASCSDCGPGGNLKTLVPLLAPSSTELESCSVFLGDSVERALEIESVGTAPVLLSGLSVEGSAFTRVDPPGEVLLAAGEVLTLTVAFVPGSPGPRVASLVV